MKNDYIPPILTTHLYIPLFKKRLGEGTFGNNEDVKLQDRKRSANLDIELVLGPRSVFRDVVHFDLK